MDRSEQLNELAAALAKAQAQIASAPKSHQGQARGGTYKYATLADVWDACRGPLTENGLSVVQFPLPSEPGTITLVTQLLHSSGQFLGGAATLGADTNNAQAYGSALTYLRRYTLAALVGVVADDDDDGQAASNGGNRGQQQRSGPQSRPPQNTQPPRQREPAPESSGDRQASTPRPAAAPSAQAPTTNSEPMVCSRPGCGTSLTKGQHDVSVRAFGQPLCPACQKQQARASA